MRLLFVASVRTKNRTRPCRLGIGLPPKNGVSVAPKPLLGIRCLSKLGYTKAVSPLKMTNFIWFFHDVFPHGLGPPEQPLDYGPISKSHRVSPGCVGICPLHPASFFQIFRDFSNMARVVFSPMVAQQFVP